MKDCPEAEEEAAKRRNAAACFAMVWDTVADIVGTAATAALVRRAVKRASARCPALGELTVSRRSFTPDYSLPRSWQENPAGEESMDQFLVLLRELVLLLRELTGTIVLRRLAQLPLPSRQLDALSRP